MQIYCWNILQFLSDIYIVTRIIYNYFLCVINFKFNISVSVVIHLKLSDVKCPIIGCHPFQTTAYKYF